MKPTRVGGKRKTEWPGPFDHAFALFNRMFADEHGLRRSRNRVKPARNALWLYSDVSRPHALTGDGFPLALNG